MAENDLTLGKIKGEIKLDLINHYDWIKSEIDYLIHKKLANFENKEQSKKVDYNELIELCNKTLDSNINEINEYFNNADNCHLLDKEIIKEKAITNYCTFLTNESVQLDDANYFIGFIILSNWYIDNNQYNFLR
jgi:hypothetical protein